MTNAPWPDQTSEPYDVMPDDVYEAARAEHDARQKRQENFGQRKWARTLRDQYIASTAPDLSNPPPNPLDLAIALSALSEQTADKSLRLIGTYKRAFVAWADAGADFNALQSKGGITANFNVQHVYRGADLWDFDDECPERLRKVIERARTEPRTKSGIGVDWQDPRTRAPDVAKPASDAQNKWLRNLRAMGYPAAMPTG